MLGEDKGMDGFVPLNLLPTVSLPDGASRGKDRSAQEQLHWDGTWKWKIKLYELGLVNLERDHSRREKQRKLGIDFST